MKNQFWSHEVTSESSFKHKFALKTDLNEKKAENYNLEKLQKILKPYIKWIKKL